MGGATKQEVIQEQQATGRAITRSRSARISFSADLPTDVCGVWADQTFCAVLHSTHPLIDFRESILEMVQEFGVCNWDEMEELVYCYISLNSSDVHCFIHDAFLSLFSS